MSAQIEAFFDPATFTYTYVVYDKHGGHAAVVDPVLDYDPKSGRTSTGSADKVLEFLKAKQLKLDWLLETHAHADHLSSAHYMREKLGGKIAIGENIKHVQKVFKTIFNLEPQFCVDGTQFDYLFKEGEVFNIGELKAEAIWVPGHTPADMAYKMGEFVFVGDTLFLPDVGTARCDFPGGNAHTLYQSIRKLLAMPADTKLMMCHDYPPNDREPRYQCTVADQRKSNIHVHDGVSEAQFVAMRTARDATLAMPNLILPSVQINIRAGEFPPAENNGVSYLKIPLNALGK